MKNEADETSPGTAASKPRSFSHGMRCRSDPSTVPMRTPSARSIRSVWSRDPILPAEPRGIRRAERGQHQAALHLRAGYGKVPGQRTPDPRRREGSTAGRTFPPSRPSIRAPISRSGSTTRPMGRPTSDSSPLSTANMPLAGKKPAEQARCGAGVLRVQGACRLGEPAEPDAADAEPPSGLR